MNAEITLRVAIGPLRKTIVTRARLPMIWTVPIEEMELILSLMLAAGLYNFPGIITMECLQGNQFLLTRCKTYTVSYTAYFAKNMQKYEICI